MSTQLMTDKTEEPTLDSTMEIKGEFQTNLNTEDGSYAVTASQNSNDAAICPPHDTASSLVTLTSHDIKNNSNESEFDASFLTSMDPLLQPRDSISALPSCDVPYNYNHKAFKQNPDQASTFELRPTTTFSSGQSLPTHKISPTSDECQPSFAKSYTSLTAWTTKLLAEGVDNSPLPSNESLPLPLVGINHQPSIPVSSAPFCLKPEPVKANFTAPYSKIGPLTTHPGMAPVDVSHIGLSAGTSSSIGVSTVPKSKLKSTLNREHRFKKTADALHKSGLWEVAMKTGNLIKRNRELQKDLEQFRSDALLFLKSVIKNPQNRDFIKNVLSNALSTSGTNQKKASVMSIVVSAAATVSVKLRSSPSTHDSGISSSSSCGSQSDHSVSSFLYTNSNSSSPGQSGQGPPDTE